ncbi:MAG: SAM-dependent methyltransferase, partial [Deltaproteobacteria bacterium]
MKATGKPYVIENVVGAPLENPVMLCGAMFPGLTVYRHRLFESNFPLNVPAHPDHVVPLRKMGRPPLAGEFMHVVGNFSGVARAKEAMGISWMVRDGLREAIPPAYTQFIGEQMKQHLVT